MLDHKYHMNMVSLQYEISELALMFRESDLWFSQKVPHLQLAQELWRGSQLRSLTVLLNSWFFSIQALCSLVFSYNSLTWFFKSFKDTSFSLYFAFSLCNSLSASWYQLSCGNLTLRYGQIQISFRLLEQGEAVGFYSPQCSN